MSKELLLNLDEMLEQKQTYLIPDNIRKGITLLGVTGTFEGEVNTNDADATAGDILINKSAYVKGEKITGTIPKYLAYTEVPINNAYSYDNQFIMRNDTGTGIYLEPNAGLVVSPSVVSNAIRLTSDIIKEGSTLLGITGTLKIGVDTTDATAVAENIEINKVAYVKGEKIVGTLPIHDDTISYTNSTAKTITGGVSITPTVTQKEILTLDSILNIEVTNSVLASAIGLTSKNLKTGYTILGISGAVEEIPEKTTRISASTTISKNNAVGTSGNYLVFKHIHDTPLLINSNVQVGYSISYSTVANFIGVTPEVIKKDTEILGVVGTYIGEAGTGTEDATATATDILSGKTAYVNKEKITGTLPVIESSTLTLNTSSVDYTYTEKEGYRLNITSANVKGTYNDGVLLRNSSVKLHLTNSQLVAALGLTSNMLAEGVTFLGVTGTYVGSGMLTETEYNEIEAIADNILAEEVE